MELKRQWNWILEQRPQLIMKRHTNPCGKIIPQTGEIVEAVEFVKNDVEYNNESAFLDLLVVPGSVRSLFGRTWLHCIKLDWKKLNHAEVRSFTIHNWYHMPVHKNYTTLSTWVSSRRSLLQNGRLLTCR